jgi:beta-glucosidase
VGTGSVSIDGAPALGLTVPCFGNLSLISATDGLANAGGRVTLAAGAHTIQVTGTTKRQVIFPPSADPLQIRLTWVTPELRQARIDAAVAASTARAVLVFAHEEGTEGVDRASLSLPLEQDGLIQAVTSANPRTARRRSQLRLPSADALG